MSSHILLVDDDPVAREGLLELLQLEGYQVTVARDGIHALDTMKQTVPDIILSDINMPNMDGLTFFRRVRENIAWLDIPFVFLTTRSAKEDTRTAYSLGADDYLVKPFDMDDLLICVSSRLQRARQLRSRYQPTPDLINGSIISVILAGLTTPTTSLLSAREFLEVDIEYPAARDVIASLVKGEIELGAVVTQTSWLLKVNWEHLHQEIQKNIHIGDMWHAITIAVSTARKSVDRDSNVTVQYGSYTPGILRANWTLLSAALTELIASEMTGSQPDRAMTIEQSVSEMEIIITIRNEHKSVSQPSIEQAFELGYLYTPGEDNAHSLGLFIARSLIEGHGGTMSISPTATGTETRITLPCIHQKSIEGNNSLAAHTYRG